MKGDREKEEALEAERRRLLRELLGYTLDARTADAACKTLWETLGGFDAALTAPEEILRGIPGVGEKAVRMLRLVEKITACRMEDRSWCMKRIFDTNSALEALSPSFSGQSQETVWLMLLDGRGRVVYNGRLCEGGIDEVPLSLRRVVELCVCSGSSDVYLAHNHPSGTALPSVSDVHATQRLLSALDGIDASLRDHIIFAGDSHFSFFRSGLLRRQREILRHCQQLTARELQRLPLAEGLRDGENEPDWRTGHGSI